MTPGFLTGEICHSIILDGVFSGKVTGVFNRTQDRIAYPNHVSVIFTDSIPLFAVIFKLFRNFLPETFQYFGLWGLLCFGLQGAFGSVLIKHYCKHDLVSIIGSIFFVITPIEIYRMFMHTALGGQWLLLFAFLLGLKKGKIIL